MGILPCFSHSEHNFGIEGTLADILGKLHVWDCEFPKKITVPQRQFEGYLWSNHLSRFIPADSEI